MKKVSGIVLGLGVLWAAVSPSAQLHGQTQSGGIPKHAFSGLEFRNIGPNRGGRVTAVAGHPDQPGHFFMGATGGGVWKSLDYGQNWENVSDGFFASPSIGAIRVAPSNAKVVYVGTGSDGIRSNVIVGKGVYKSMDSGKTWKHLGLEQTGHIGAVEVHPSNPDIAFVAAIGNAFAPNSERGVYKTTDGGGSWNKVLFLNDTVGFADLEFHPTNPNVVYAAAWHVDRKPWTIISGGTEGGIYKSEDMGKTWRKVSQGLPKVVIGKIDLAVSPAAPNRVFALVEALPGEGGLYRSEDFGESWTLVSTKKELLDRPFYYCNVDVNPLNPDVLFVSSTDFWRSNDGGKNWFSVSVPHGDNHEIWINPRDTSEWIQCNDGGANITRDGGKNWSTQENQSTAELYQVEVDDQFPYWLYAGQQDNTTIAIPSLPPYDAPAGTKSFWMAVGGCETGPAVPKPGNHHIVYSNCKGCFGVYDKRTGQERQYFIGASNIYGHNPKDLKYRFQRVTPIHVSPHNPNVVYYGSQYLHKTTDDGVNWQVISPDLTAFEPDKQVISGSPITRDVTGEEFYSTIYDINESRVQPGLIWVGANDGPVHITRDGGKKWINVSPKDMPKGGRVDCVEPSPHLASKGYFATLLYQLGDPKPYIYKTTNFGQSWTLLTSGNNGIPADYPVRVVREDPVRAGLLYAGTEYGLFVSFDDGASWVSFQQNLPITPITDIKVVEGDLVLSTMGRGFWILDNLSALRQVSTAIAAKPVHLFKPANQYRLRYAASNTTPEYPAPRVLIDYYVGASVEGAVKLEILNAQKKAIRVFTSERPSKEGPVGASAPVMATGFVEAGYSDNLKKTAGLHRFSWDMRHLGSWDSSRPRSSRGAPMAAPGTYYVQLTINGETQTQPFQLLMDPRQKASGMTERDLIDQEVLGLQVVELESSAKQLSDQIEQKRKGMAVGSAERMPYDKLQEQLITASGRYMTPVLLGQISYLRGVIDQADQKPGRDAVQRYAELKTWYNKVAESWKKLDGPAGGVKVLD